MCRPKPLFIPWRIGSLVIALGTVVSPLAAQYPVGPVYPENRPANVQPPQRNLQSGEDPFQYNPYSGRFDYVPIPYEFSPGTAGAPAYGFNWHSGRWDYVPAPAVNSSNLGMAREVTPGNYLDGRVFPQMSNGATGAGEEAQAASAAIGPSQAQEKLITRAAASPPQPKKPTTTPATQPVTNPPPPPAMRVRLAGHWEFDYATGRWVFVLPSD